MIAKWKPLNRANVVKAYSEGYEQSVLMVYDAFKKTTYSGTLQSFTNDTITLENGSATKTIRFTARVGLMMARIALPEVEMKVGDAQLPLG